MTVTRFATACSIGRHFPNGTAGEAWQGNWCNYCTRDHDAHDGSFRNGGCGLWLTALNHEWPEGWIPEPDDDTHKSHSYLVCTAFSPCDDCEGDPEADGRARLVTHVTDYWRKADRS